MSSQEDQGARRPSIALPIGFAAVIALFASVLIRWPDNFFADDSYFYFQVAWNIARGFGSTFNNVIPTNGYHPLWMMVCVAVFKILPSKIAALHGIGAVISFLDICSFAVICFLVRRIAPGFWWVALFLFIPFCFLSQLGTEGALSGLALACLTLTAYLLCTEPDRNHAFLFALSGALAVLSRLDNIFVVGLINLAVVVGSPSSVRAAIRRLIPACIPIYVLLWGAYVATNLYWFGTVQPISGLLKAHAHGESRTITMPPHIALAGLLIIVPGILILWRFRRDVFFHVVEVPFALGVIIHAAYIAFVMSSETRWSWYYTSWMLLSAIVLSRVASIALARTSLNLRTGLAAASLLMLFLVWWKLSYKNLAHPIPDAVAVGYQANLSDRLHMHTVLAFDKPGRMAYYTDVQVVALDGLMGDIQFQRDLATKGIQAFDQLHHVDGFIGPTEPLDKSQQATFCDRIYLSSVKLHCSQSPSGEWIADSAEVFARLSGASAGTIPLPPQNLVWNYPSQVAAWRLPERAIRSAGP